jgi:putative transposase
MHDLPLMRRLDRLRVEYAFAGSRMLTGLLTAEGAGSTAGMLKKLMQQWGKRRFIGSAAHPAGVP